MQRAAATADAHKVVKAKLDAAAKSGDVEATNKANRELWNASNTLGSAKKDLEKLKDYLKWAQDRIAAYKKAVDYYSSLPPCPEEKKTTETGGGGGGEFKKETGKTRRYEPRFVHPFGETISRVVTGTDSEKWCTYGDGVQFETALVATDESGAPIDVSKETEGALEEVESVLTALNEEGGHPDGKPAEPSGVPAEEMPLPQPTEPATPSGPAPETSKAPETPTTTEQPPPPTTPEMPTTTPEMPTTTEKPPEEPASPIPDTIFVKAKESVLEGQPTGSPIENQVVKLFPPEEPQLPGEGGSKEAQDTGFDKDPVECTTGADGNCQMHVATEDRALYGMPSTGANPGKTYRIDYDLPQTSGGVAETTGRPAEPDVTSGTPGGAKVTRQVFRIGERTFIRLVYEQPHGLDHNFEEQFKPIFGENYEEDDCRDKQPGPPLGMEPRSYSSLDRELPESIVKLASGTMRRAARTAPPLPAHSNERTPPAGALAHRQLSN